MPILIIDHGQDICKARRIDCGHDFLNKEKRRDLKTEPTTVLPTQLTAEAQGLLPYKD